MANPTLFGIDLIVLLTFLLVLIITMVAARATYSCIRKLLDLRVGKRRSKVVSNLVQYVILSIGIGYGILGVLRLDLTALAASLGLVGIAIAFSSQQLIQNFVAGVMISLDRRIQMEDWIEITNDPSNRPSRVVDVTLTRTLLRDVNGRMTTVPNSLLITNRVVNYTQSGFVEVLIPFPMPVGSDRKMVSEVILKVLEDHPKVLPNLQGAELVATQRELNISRFKRFQGDRSKLDSFAPRVLVQEVTNLRVVLTIRFWIREVQFRDVIVSEVLTSILDRLKAQGVEVP